MSQEIKTVFAYNGAEYAFDVRDAEDAARYEDAIEQMKEVEKTIPKDGRASTMIMLQCKMVKAFFDCCLGDGAGNAICTEKNNISVCYAAYEAFLQYASAQKSDVINAKNTFAKYSNRAQRRALPHAVK